MEKYCDTNLNYYIKIKLTEEGRIIYKKHYAKYNCEAPKLNIDNEGYVQFQIHDFMNIFGERLFMGVTLPCETNCKIQVKDDWHYVKDGDLPKVGVKVLSEQGSLVIYKGDGFNWVEFSPNADNIKLRKWEEPIAWKEIVLPELPKESE